MGNNKDFAFGVVEFKNNPYVQIYPLEVINDVELRFMESKASDRVYLNEAEKFYKEAKDVSLFVESKSGIDESVHLGACGDYKIVVFSTFKKALDYADTLLTNRIFNICIKGVV